MNVRRRLALLLCVWMVAASTMMAGEGTPRYCGNSSVRFQHMQVTDIGGRYIPARGTFRVLVVFASFPDDYTPNPYWPARQAPTFLSQIIDSDTLVLSASSHNLTNYFRQMSLGTLNVIGEAIWVETRHSQEEYRNGAYGRANRDVLMECVDSLIDFTRYDSWSHTGPYQVHNTPDGIVDMIIMVWRTNMFEFLGEASLGYRTAFVVDGKRIEMGYPEYLPMPLGSGVTVQALYTDSPYNVMQTAVHELSHWLLGAPHPYNGESLHGKRAYWGMLCNPQRVASCANAYERERLGWISVPDLPPDSTVLLTDYVTTGAAWKFRPPNGEAAEYFYLEAHLKQSVFDDVTANPGDKGVWILHQQGPYMEVDNLCIRPADGNWHWVASRTTAACFSQSLPEFRRDVPRVTSGFSHREQIPIPGSAVNWLLAYRDEAGTLHCGKFATGLLFSGAFKGGAVFSPFSNPSSHNWNRQQTAFSLAVMEQAGEFSIRSYGNPLDAPPASRYLGRDTASAFQRQPTLVWGSSWPDAQPVEPDVVRCELQMLVSPFSSWETVYFGPMFSWQHPTAVQDSMGQRVAFRVRVQDAQNFFSVWSNVYTMLLSGVTSVDARSAQMSDELHVFPNPANPATTILFRSDGQSRVALTIYNLLGQEIKNLAEGFFAEGTHSILWDGTTAAGTDAASGVYLVRYSIGKTVMHRKIILAR